MIEENIPGVIEVPFDSVQSYATVYFYFATYFNNVFVGN